jgi:phenylacetate-CoA oxygenase PaaJ subunit
MPEAIAQVEIPKRALFKAAEVCELAKVQPYVLRSWESEFPDLGVAKTEGAPRTYRREDVEQVLRDNGFTDVEVETVLTPAWTTDWLSEKGKAALAEHGIAPPGPVLVPLSGPLACPRCGSRDTEELSRFGATACKALHRCRACREPFEHFKAH